MARNNYLEQLERRREQITTSTPASATTGKTTDKTPEEMTGEELEEALNRARRDLLDAQHQELRERELARARLPGQGNTPPSSGRTALADLLREKQRGKRRTWR